MSHCPDLGSALDWSRRMGNWFDWYDWFNLESTLLFREFYKLQGKINLFFPKSFVHQRLIHYSWSFCDAWCLNGRLFYHIAAGTNLKNETNQSNEVSHTWHKRSETSHFTHSKVTISHTKSCKWNQLIKWNELLYSLAIEHNGPLWSRMYQLNGVIALALWPIAVTKQVNWVSVLGGHWAKQMLLY